MKTSNKILVTAVSLTLLYLVANVGLLLRGYAATKSEGEALLTQFSEQPIRTLITTGEVYVDFYNLPDRQNIGIYGVLRAGQEHIRISGDTLYLSNPSLHHYTLSLPHLESYLKNGEPTEIQLR